VRLWRSQSFMYPERWHAVGSSVEVMMLLAWTPSAVYGLPVVGLQTTKAVALPPHFAVARALRAENALKSPPACPALVVPRLMSARRLPKDVRRDLLDFAPLAKEEGLSRRMGPPNGRAEHVAVHDRSAGVEVPFTLAGLPRRSPCCG